MKSIFINTILLTTTVMLELDLDDRGGLAKLVTNENIKKPANVSYSQNVVIFNYYD